MDFWFFKIVCLSPLFELSFNHAYWDTYKGSKGDIIYMKTHLVTGNPKTVSDKRHIFCSDFTYKSSNEDEYTTKNLNTFPQPPNLAQINNLIL